MGKYSISLTLALAAGTWAKTALSAAETAPDVNPAVTQAAPREPIVGVGFHPGNFVGPLAFDIILRPLPHIAVDLQVGTWSSDNDLRGLGVAPQVQWEFLRGLQTPYVGLGFRHEEVWSDGVMASSNGGFLVGGWQRRWQSGFGVLVGGGVLYMTPVTLIAPRVQYWSGGGLYGTYEVGVRYFF
jgi:hypothetical protein